MIPAMTDADLSSLHANATKLMLHGSVGQVTAAADVIPLIEAETERRAARPKPTPVPRKRAIVKKLAPVTGHQTALPSRT